MKMKHLIKLAAMALLGLSLLSATASAVTHSVSASAGGYSGFYDGMDPFVPAGAAISWYAYAYGDAQARIEVGGVYMLVEYAPSNGSVSSSDTISSAGGLSARVYGQTFAGAAGAGVSVSW